MFLRLGALVRLSKGVNLPLKIDATLRCREGSPKGRGPLRRRGFPRLRGPPRRRGLPRPGQLLLGEPGNMECGISGLPRRGTRRR